MLIGDPRRFAIECHHDPIPNDTQRVFGRICIHTAAGQLGDVQVPWCMLNVTEATLLRALHNLPGLDNSELANMPDGKAFEFLDRTLYHGFERSKEALCLAHTRYFKHDFLTSGGESFDGTKSFITVAADEVRILFSAGRHVAQGAHVPADEFRDIIRKFFDWLKREGVKVPRA